MLLDGAPDITEPNHKEGIYCVNFDRNILAAGSRDKLIRLWDMQDLRYLRSLEAHEGSVLCLQLDSSRGILVSGSSDASIKVWDLRGGKVVQTLRGHSESVLGLHFDEEYIVSCSKDTTARIWHICEDQSRTGEVFAGISRYVCLHTLHGHRAAVNSVHFKGNVIATASGDRTVRIWNLITGIMIRTIGAHPRGIACVNIAGNFVVTGSSDHVIRIFDLADGEEVRTLRGHSGLVRTIQTDDTMIISGSYDQSIRIWDINSGKMLYELGRCHESKYLHLRDYMAYRAGSFGFIEISAGLYRATEMQGLWFGILRDAIQAIRLATSFLQRRSMQHFFDQVTGNIFA
jgi:F-box and WD-40 domain protein 1/11